MRNLPIAKKPDFTVVEIEVNSLCNRSCSYCPVSVLPIPKTPRNMSIELYHKVMDELKAMDYVGLLSYHLYNEPLIRKDLSRLVEIAAEKIPNAFQLLFTNGDLLNDKRYQELLDAGINHFLVTRHNHTPIPERPFQSIQYPEELVLSNRGGLLQDVEQVKSPLNNPCYSPSDNLIITSSGDVILCCDDAKRSEVMGNLNEQTIAQVWYSKRFELIRKELQKSNRSITKLCTSCNNLEYAEKGHNYQSHFVAEDE